MVKVHRFSVGEMQSNCYLLENNNHCIIIDPGDDADYITSKIIELRLKPNFIVSTHGHFDHNMASFEISQNFNIPFYISDKDTFLIKRMRATARHWFKRNDILLPQINTIESRLLKLGNLNIKVIEIPGHTPGSLAYYIEKSGIMFAGDLLFKGGGLGRIDFEYSNKEDFKNSLKNVLSYPSNTLIYPGHGEKFRLSEFSI